MTIILLVLTLFFAINMGGSNFGVTFAAACGSQILSKRQAQVLYIIFVILGALLCGRFVADTLGHRLVSSDIMSLDVCLIMIGSAVLSLYISNLLRVPQSTSLVTVAAILGPGVYFHDVIWTTFWAMVPFWILIPIAGYLLTYAFGCLVYPPRQKNLWIYEKLVNHLPRLRAFVILSSCYNAFCVGSNNVANAIGPLLGLGIVDVVVGLAIVSPFFGLGGVVFAKSLETSSEKIVPLGLLTASLICLICGSLILIASLCGVPQSFVMVKVACIFAIASLKGENGHLNTFNQPVSRKVLYSWGITPVVAFVVSFAVTYLRYHFL